MGKETIICSEKTFEPNSTFDLLEDLKSENNVDISLSTLLGEDFSSVSSPDSYLSNSTEEDFEDLITPPDSKKELKFPIGNDDFISSFLSGSNNYDDQKSKKRKDRKTPKGEDGDPKKQQRLIKNRESAQASRERKKMYLKDLEKTVNDLSSNNKDLSGKISSLEDENNKLREQLLRASKGEKITDLPPTKKQKVSPSSQKLPLPSYSQMQFLHPQYWVQMFNGQSQQGQQNWQNPGPKVVLFVALFCVALFLVKTPQDKETEINHQRIGRILQQMKTEKDSDLKTVQHLFENLSNDSMDTKFQETLGKIKIKWNKETDSLTFGFPTTENESPHEITISKKLFSDICEKVENKDVV